MKMSKQQFILGAGMIALAAVCLAGCGKTSADEALQSARAAMQKGQLAQAKFDFENAMMADPLVTDRWEVYNDLALVNFRLGLTNEAIAGFESAIKLSGTNAAPLYNLGVALMESSDVSRGLSILVKVGSLEAPEGIKALIYVAEWTTRSGRIPMARNMYQKILKQDSKSLEALTGLGRIDMLEEKYPAAETRFMEALAVDSNYAPALYNLGVLYMQMEGQADQSREYFKRYLTVAPKGERATQAEARIRGESIPQESFTKAGTPPAPAVTAEQLWEQATTAINAKNQVGGFSYGMRALELSRTQNVAPAKREEYLKVMENHFGTRWEVQLERARHESLAGNLAAAKDILMRAHASNSNNADILMELVDVSTKQGEHDAALLSLRQLLRMQPDNADAVWKLAELYEKHLEIPSRAIDNYKQFTLQFPEDPRARLVPERLQILERAP